MSTDSRDGLKALSGSLVAITTVICGLRFYARRVQQANFGVDDWMIIPSFITFIGMVACALLGEHLHQFGYTAKQVKAFGLTFEVQAALVVSLDILSAASLGFTRISALLFYRRIFCVPGRTVYLRSAIYTSIVIISLWMVAFIILPPLQCGPDLSVWSAPTAVRAKYCTMGNQIILGFCISDLVIETVVIAMPVPKILQLRTSLRRRLAVLFVFLLAFVSFGAVVARLVIVSRILHGKVTDKSQSNTTQTFMWILEAGFALIAVNLPSLWWLRKKVSPEKVLASARSVFSLHSIRSRQSGSGSHGSKRSGATTQTAKTVGSDKRTARDKYEGGEMGTESEEKLPESMRAGLVERGLSGDGASKVSDESDGMRGDAVGHDERFGNKASEGGYIV